jgi:hypothetical protein
VAGEATYGTITAIRPLNGTIAWQRRTEPLWSGALVTAGGLVFVGQTDGWFRAYDASTGHPLWEFFCGAGVNAPPVSFELDGEQFVAVVAAGSRYSELHGSTLLIFGLGDGKGTKPTIGAGADAQPAPRAAPDRGAPWPPQNAIRVGRFLSFSAAGHTAWVEVDAGRLSFDGAINGARTFVVPLEWTVEVRFRNRDAAPHSARVVADARPVPLVPGPPSFAGAETASAETLPAGQQDVFTFRADLAGAFLIACGVPGHAAGGMFLRLVVSADVTAPSYR